jgi:FkbM family methyltransferase
MSGQKKGPLGLPVGLYRKCRDAMNDASTLRHRGRLADPKHSIYEWDFSGRKIYGTLAQASGFRMEYLAGSFPDFYGTDFKGKTVLDVGGYAGDSAMHFMEHGASRVIIYEPVEENVAAAKLNLRQYEGRFEIHQGFVCDRTGSAIVSSSDKPGTHGFGLTGGGHSVELKCIPVDSLLRPGIDYAKFDCEGCEYHLAGVPHEALRRIPEWSIEFHLEGNMDRYRDTLNKFYSSGFELKKIVRAAPWIYVACFRKAQ